MGSDNLPAKGEQSRNPLLVILGEESLSCFVMPSQAQSIRLHCHDLPVKALEHLRFFCLSDP
ncbi:hypothetical protein DPMN_082046 [Dreissena polymorpha]|uniref:Uncharacterized protein n=1 Tax=Dreissena polymorpha TaxID=45954 RepID=A0A9D3Y8H5_DREPO|nr:hypothetical protein DPMN_082046 [Dreissena polymorpha]